MSTPSGFLRGSRALFAAAKSAAPAPKTNISSSASKKPTTAAAAAASESSAVPKEKKKLTTGIMKPTPVSLTLQGFVGAPQISRAEAIKKVWDYIKLHKLQVLLQESSIFFCLWSFLVCWNGCVCEDFVRVFLFVWFIFLPLAVQMASANGRENGI